MIDILKAYLSYETSISIEYDNSSQISLPGITICFDKSDILRHEELNNTNISNEIRSDEWRLKDYFNYNMTIKEQNQLLLSKDEIFANASCQVMETIGVEAKNKENDTYLDCQHLSPIVESIDYRSKCFTLFNQSIDEQANKNFIIDYSTRIFSDMYFEIITLVIPSYIRYAILHFHRRTEPLIKYSENNFIVAEPKKDTLTMIYYKKTTVKLLPSPFKTDCHEFGDANSRQSCVARCRRNEMIRRREAWPDVYLATNLSMKLSMFKVWGNVSFTFDDEVAEFCIGKCNKKIECTQEIYEMKLERFEEKMHYNKGVIAIMPPIVPDQGIKYTQKMCFVELVCFLGSLISLYFGFTIIMLTDIIALVTKFIFNNVLIVLKIKVDNWWPTKTKQKIQVINNIIKVNHLILNDNYVTGRNISIEERIE